MPRWRLSPKQCFSFCIPRSIDLLDFPALALLARTSSTFASPFGVSHYLLIAVLYLEFDSATVIQSAVRAWLIRDARYPAAVDLPQAYITFVVTREEDRGAQAQIYFELEQAHNAPEEKEIYYSTTAEMILAQPCPTP